MNNHKSNHTSSSISTGNRHQVVPTAAAPTAEIGPGTTTTTTSKKAMTTNDKGILPNHGRSDDREIPRVQNNDSVDGFKKDSIIPRGGGDDGAGGSTVNNKENNENRYEASSTSSDRHTTEERRVSKKRRLESSSSASNTTFQTHSQTQISHSSSNWQDIYRQGTHFKAMLDGVLGQVATAASERAASIVDAGGRTSLFVNVGGEGHGNNSIQDGGPDVGSSNNRNDDNKSILGKLLHSKQVDLLRLKQELESLKTEKAALVTINEDLRGNKMKQDEHIQKLTEALQRSSAKATKARNDADEAKAEAETFSAKLEALDVVVKETNRASHVLMAEQEELIEKSQAVEQRFVEAQADLARSEASKLKFQQNHDAMALKLKDAEDRLDKANKELNEERSAKEDALQKIEELEAVNKTKDGRLARLEEELRKSQELSSDMSSAIAEAASAKDQLQSALEKLQDANQDLHKKLQQEQEKQLQQHKKHQDALSVLQEKNRATIAEMESYRDNASAMKLEKVAAEKKITGLESRLANLQRQINDSMDLTGTTRTPATSKTNMFSGSLVGVGGPLATVDERTTELFGGDYDNVGDTIPKLPSLPALVSAKKDRHGKTVPKCAFCFKDVTGPSRKCQCGKKDCTARAHAQCAMRFVSAGTSTSVSHRKFEAAKVQDVVFVVSFAFAL